MTIYKWLESQNKPDLFGSRRPLAKTNANESVNRFTWIHTANTVVDMLIVDQKYGSH